MYENVRWLQLEICSVEIKLIDMWLKDTNWKQKERASKVSKRVLRPTAVCKGCREKEKKMLSGITTQRGVRKREIGSGGGRGVDWGKAYEILKEAEDFWGGIWISLLCPVIGRRENWIPDVTDVYGRDGDQK